MNTSPLSLEKKINCCLHNFRKIGYVACAIKRTGQLICLRASLRERDRVGLSDKAAFKSKVH